MIYVSGWLGTRMTLMLGDGDAPATAVGEDEHCMKVASAYLASEFLHHTNVGVRDTGTRMAVDVGLFWEPHRSFSLVKIQ